MTHWLDRLAENWLLLLLVLRIWRTAVISSVVQETECLFDAGVHFIWTPFHIFQCQVGYTSVAVDVD